MSESWPEHVVVVAALVQQIDPGADIVRVLAMGEKLEIKAAAAAAVHSDAVIVLKLDWMDQLIVALFPRALLHG